MVQYSSVFARIIRDMDAYTLYPKPNLSKRYHSQYIRPYLLRHLTISRPNQVWGINITYIRMQKGFMYLFVIIDWYSRYIVDYELYGTLDKSFALSCLKRTLSRQKVEIINSNQGGHFTKSRELRSMLNEYMKTYNAYRPHSSLDGACPCDYYKKGKLGEAA